MAGRILAVAASFASSLSGGGISGSLFTCPFANLPSHILILSTLFVALIFGGIGIYIIISRREMGLRQQRASSSTAEFKGDIKVNNNPPTKADLERAADLVVLDKDKKKHTFKSLYADNEHGPRRVLVVFIRHFFCGVSVFLSQPIVRTFPSFYSTVDSKTTINQNLT